MAIYISGLLSKTSTYVEGVYVVDGYFLDCYNYWGTCGAKKVYSND